jgi:AraC-like DNA-binding protein
MITIKNINPNPLLSKYIRRISVFICKHPFTYRQKLTPSAYTYLSYNRKQIPVSVFGRKRIHPTSRLQIAGPKIHENIYVDYNGTLEQILIEFTASGFYYLFHRSPSLYINSLHSLDEIAASPATGILEANIKQCRTMQDRINLLEGFLLETSGNAMRPCDQIEESLKLIEDARGHITVKEITKRISVSERQLDRRFREIVGISPKQYANIIQLHFVINLMYIKKYSSFQDIAFFASYYDLPHFYHRFKELTGFSPVEFINSESHLAFQYYTDLIHKKSKRL